MIGPSAHTSATHRPGPRGASAAWVVVLVVTVALGLRLYHLGRESFWIDEVFQRDVSAQAPAHIVAEYRPHPGETGHLRDQAPLSHLLFHPFVGSGPTSDEATARLPSALAGALATGVFWLLARELVPPAVAALATALLVFSPLDLWYSQECRFYELWTLFATSSYYALVRALTGSARWWIAYTLLAIAGLYTCLMHALVLAAQAVTVLWSARRSVRLRAVAPAAIVVAVAIAVATLPVAWLVVGEHGRPAGTPRPPSFTSLPYTLFAFAAGYSLGPTVESLHALPSPLAVARAYPSVLLVVLVFGVAAVAGLRRLTGWPSARAVLVPWLFVPPLGVFALSWTTAIVYNVRYALASLSAFLVVVAAGALASSSRPRRVLDVAAVVTLTLIAGACFYWEPRYDKAQAREALAFITAADPDAQVVMVGQIGRVVDYYTRGTGAVVLTTCDPGLLALDAPGSGTLWVTAGRDWEGRAPLCLARLADSYRVIEYRPFVGIEVWRLESRR